MDDICCEVAGCTSPAAWYRIVCIDVTNGLCLCDGHRDELRSSNPDHASFYAPIHAASGRQGSATDADDEEALPLAA